MINGTKVLPDDKTPLDQSRTRRIGAVLFTVNDAEARWRGWTVTELRGGLARRYRDPGFDTWTGAQGEAEIERSPLPGAGLLLLLRRGRPVHRPD